MRANVGELGLAVNQVDIYPSEFESRRSPWRINMLWYNTNIDLAELFGVQRLPLKEYPFDLFDFQKAALKAIEDPEDEYFIIDSISQK